MRNWAKVAGVLIALLPVTISAAGLGTIKLEWDANTEPDMAKYRVYVNGVRTADVAHPTTTHTYTPIGEGVFEFYVTAMDTSGNESGPSNKVSVTVNLPPQPPANCRATVQR